MSYKLGDSTFDIARTGLAGVGRAAAGRAAAGRGRGGGGGSGFTPGGGRGNAFQARARRARRGGYNTGSMIGDPTADYRDLSGDNARQCADAPRLVAKYGYSLAPPSEAVAL